MPGADHTGPRPFAASSTVCGRPHEVVELMEGVRVSLEGDGWVVDGADDGEPPLRALRLSSGTQWLTLVSAPVAPHRLGWPSEIELTASGVAAEHARLHELVTALPFTALELELFAHDMPLTAGTPQRVQQWLPSLDLTGAPLEGYGAVFTIHHQTDFVLLLETALSLGIDPGLSTVIDKEYRYRYTRRVDAHIRKRLGISVYRFSEISAGLSDHIRRVEAAREHSGAKTWTPTIVLDDGGYVLPRLLTDFSSYISLFRGVVEQTTSGIWALRPFADDLRVPIFSVAESELKTTVEAQGVAQAALTNLRRLLPNEKLGGRTAVVVGYGRVGQALADLLRRSSLDVHVADSVAPMLVAAREEGFATGDSLPALIRRVQPRYLFSCARPAAVGRDCIEQINSDCVLVSLTSRDTAFDKQALAEIGTAEPFGNVGTLFVREQPPCSMLLVSDGFPVNFHFAESMPNQQSDVIMASLLVGAVTLARSVPAWPAGNDAWRANAILNEGTLLRDSLVSQPSLGRTR